MYRMVWRTYVVLQHGFQHISLKKFTKSFQQICDSFDKKQISWEEILLQHKRRRTYFETFTVILCGPNFSFRQCHVIKLRFTRQLSILSNSLHI